MNKLTQTLQIYLSRKMLAALSMGFTCGLPLLLTIGLLQAWLKDSGVNLGAIGLVSLLQIPYTWKFIWAPIFDRFTLPFLGRRRGWLLVSQICVILAIALIGLSDPVKTPLLLVAAAVLTAFFSASQDIVVDAYRREDLNDQELGMGSSMYIMGYRIGMLLASGIGLILADYMSFNAVYLIMAAFMLIGVITTLLTPEPATMLRPPRSLKETVLDPLIEYFSRNKAITILLFILLYKIGDTMASGITTPFYMEMGFSKAEIGTIVKLFGFWATIIGAFAGGVLLTRFGLYKCLWLFGILQMLATSGFIVLAEVGYSTKLLAAVISGENFAAGMGTAAFMAYMAFLTNKRFTATQYALLSSLMSIPRVVASAATGYMANYMGWTGFFVFCMLIAIPALLLLLVLKSTTQSSG